MQAVLSNIKDQDVRIFDILVADECTDMETFLSLDNNDFIRLKLTTKMIRTIQQFQKRCENELPVEEIFIVEPVASPVPSDPPAPPAPTDPVASFDQPAISEENIYKGIDLEQLIDVKDILDKTPKGQCIIETLQDCEAHINDRLITDITHTLCDYLVAVYGLHPPVFYKDNLAKSLVKTFPRLASTAVPEVPQSLWFHKHGRGRNKHCGKINYRMETLAKKSAERVVVRPSKNAVRQELQPVTLPKIEAPNLDELLNELQFIIPGDETKSRIFDLWKQTFSFRSEQRGAGNFMQFLNDYPQSLGFGGALIAEDFHLIHPNCKDFDSQWDELEMKVVTAYKLFAHIKNHFIRALAILRDKNPTKGRKNTKDIDARKVNPLHGIIDWVQNKEEIGACDVPQLFVIAPEFEEGVCFLVWNDLMIQVDGTMRDGFILLLKSFSAFSVKSLPSDSAFYSFFKSTIFGIERPSTTANKIFLQLLQLK